jgi:hypothetical protein
MNAEGPLIKSQRHTLKTLGVLTNCPKSAHYLSKVAGKIQTAEEPASSPLTASATFALKASVWFRRGRLFIVSPDSRANLARRQAETPLIALFRFPEPALPSGILTPFRSEICTPTITSANMSPSEIDKTSRSATGDGASSALQA